MLKYYTREYNQISIEKLFVFLSFLFLFYLLIEMRIIEKKKKNNTRKQYKKLIVLKTKNENSWAEEIAIIFRNTQCNIVKRILVSSFELSIHHR